MTEPLVVVFCCLPPVFRLKPDHGDGGRGSSAGRGGGGRELWATASLQTGGMSSTEPKPRHCTFGAVSL